MFNIKYQKNIDNSSFKTLEFFLNINILDYLECYTIKNFFQLYNLIWETNINILGFDRVTLTCFLKFFKLFIVGNLPNTKLVFK